MLLNYLKVILCLSRTFAIIDIVHELGYKCVTLLRSVYRLTGRDLWFNPYLRSLRGLLCLKFSEGGRSMGPGSVLQSQSFKLSSADYLARQDLIFDAAVEAILGLGKEFLCGFLKLGAIETKANGRLDGCLLLWAIDEADNPKFLAIEAKRVSSWFFKSMYQVTVHWAIPNGAIAPVLRLCNHSEKVPTTGQSRSEPLASWLSNRIPEIEVVGCKPGYYATLESIDGQLEIALFAED